MPFRDRHFRSGIALALLLAVLAMVLANLPGLNHLGPLSLALLLGLAWRSFNYVPVESKLGIGFSAKTLLRLGIVLLGVRLNLDLVLHAGLKILLIDVGVIVAGLTGISWLGRRLGLDSSLAYLIAVDSSICGASAAAAAGPTVGAKEEDMALVIPLCSLIGTTAMLILTMLQHYHPIDPRHYGLFCGASLHEVAQVMAAINPIPGAVETGTVAKLTRVVLLVPVVFVLGSILRREKVAAVAGASSGSKTKGPPKPWFVAGFLGVAIVNTALFRFLPEQHETLLNLNHSVLSAATFIMAIAMAAMGLQVDFGHIRDKGGRAVITAVVGWLGLASLAAAEIALAG